MPFFSESPVWSQLNQRVLKPLSGILYQIFTCVVQWNTLQWNTLPSHMYCTVKDSELMHTTNVLHSMRQGLNRVQWCIKEQWLCTTVENSEMLSG